MIIRYQQNIFKNYISTNRNYLNHKHAIKENIEMYSPTTVLTHKIREYTAIWCWNIQMHLLLKCGL